MTQIASNITFWINNARIKHAAPQSVLPAILAVCMASTYASFSLPLAILSTLGIVLGHAIGNLFDDYFDFTRKNDLSENKPKHRGIRSYRTKCPYITSGATTVKRLLFVSCLLSAITIIIGLILIYYRGIGILYFMVISGILIISYSGMPLRLSFHGLGEILIGILFGPLNMLGVYYAACGTIHMAVILVSIPVGFFVANILYVHSILDFEPDKEVGKNTLAVLIDNKKAMLAAEFIFVFAPYAIIAYGILAGYISSYFWLLMLTLPLAIYLFYMMVEFVRNPERRFDRHAWMGPISRWDHAKKTGTDWFMLRWMIARNLLSSFCIITIFITLINRL